MDSYFSINARRVEKDRLFDMTCELLSLPTFAAVPAILNLPCFSAVLQQ